MGDACRITARRGRHQVSVTAAVDAPYVRALRAVGWSVTAVPLPERDEPTRVPEVAPVSELERTAARAAEDVDGW
jgi:hypothetical protein